MRDFTYAWQNLLEDEKALTKIAFDNKWAQFKGGLDYAVYITTASQKFYCG